MVVKQIASGLNRGLSTNFWCLRSANHVKFTKQCVICMEKHVLVKKKVYSWVKYGFATMRLSQKDSLSCGNTLTLHKEKVLGPVVSKEGHADSLLKELITIDFLEKQFSYCQLLSKFTIFIK